MKEYKKARSNFYLKIYDDESNQVNITANAMTKQLIDTLAPQLVLCSPIGWKKSLNYRELFTLWIPSNRMDWSVLESVESWAKKANQHIWLSTNRNTETYFKGTEVDYCLAADWNFNWDFEKRTTIGEAEYQLKYNYPKHLVSKENASHYATVLSEAVLDCINCLAIDWNQFVVVSMPSTKDKQNKLAWQLARSVAKEIDCPFVKVTLMKDKPQMKNQTIDHKIKIWKGIFNNCAMINFSEDIFGKDLLIIDDLYQSGASIWCFAEYLKNVWGVGTVIAITPVKALKDGGNK